MTKKNAQNSPVSASQVMAYVEVRDGQKVMRIEQTVTTVPVTKRGIEWSRSETAVNNVVFDLAEIPAIMSAIAAGLLSDETTMKRDAVLAIVDDITAEQSFQSFYSVSEAREAMEGAKATEMYIYRGTADLEGLSRASTEHKILAFSDGHGEG